MKYKIERIGFFKWQVVGLEYEITLNDETCTYKNPTIPILFDSFWRAKQYFINL